MAKCEFKSSIYNYQLETPEAILCYNTFTGSFVAIDKNQSAKLFNDIINEPNKLFDNNEYLTMRKQLIEQGFLIPNDIDERKLLELSLQTDRFTQKNFSLTIIPEQSCNFACPYCFQGEKAYKTMSLEIENKIIKYVQDNFYLDYITDLHVSWYGGEPLLNFASIERLAEKLIALCSKNNIKYNSGIVTNGYLLSKDVVKKLIKMGVSFIQVTLDGPQKVHDSRRFLVSGEGTFAAIVSNIVSFIDLLNKITLNIRINVDKTNYESIYELIDYLSDDTCLTNKVYLNFASVDNSNKTYDTNLCFKSQLFEEVNTNFIDYASKKGWDMERTRKPKLFPGVACTAEKFNSMVIGSDGSIYKCWNVIEHDDYLLGNISDESFSGILRINSKNCYMFSDCLKVEKCKNCTILPVCNGGGCPHLRTKYESESNLDDYICKGAYDQIRKYMLRTYKEFSDK